MKMKRNLLVICLSILFFSSFPMATNAAAQSAPVKSSILLKLNQFYVVYTAPRAPYIDSQNRLMVPLRSLSDLLAAKVTYDPVNKVAVISRQDNQNKDRSDNLKLTVGKKDIEINGVKSKMDTTPELIQGNMFIPLSVITKALHIDTNWNKEEGMVTLQTDPAYLPSGVVSDELHFVSGKLNLNVRPVSSTFRTRNNKGTPLATVHLTSVNKGTTSLTSKDHLHFYIEDSHGPSYFDIYNKDLTKPGAKFTVQTTNTLLAESLKYILVGAYTD